jgi:hypothetical protein
MRCARFFLGIGTNVSPVIGLISMRHSTPSRRSSGRAV